MSRQLRPSLDPDSRKRRSMSPPIPPSKRNIAVVACVACKRKKSKCSDGTPNVKDCNSCIARNIVCEWDMNEEERSQRKLRDIRQIQQQEISDLRSLLVPLATSTRRSDAIRIAESIAQHGFEHISAQDAISLLQDDTWPATTMAPAIPAARRQLHPQSLSARAPTASAMELSMEPLQSPTPRAPQEAMPPAFEFGGSPSPAAVSSRGFQVGSRAGWRQAAQHQLGRVPPGAFHPSRFPPQALQRQETSLPLLQQARRQQASPPAHWADATTSSPSAAVDAETSPFLQSSSDASYLRVHDNFDLFESGFGVPSSQAAESSGESWPSMYSPFDPNFPN